MTFYEKFRSFLIKKYGLEITNALLEKDRLHLKQGKADEVYWNHSSVVQQKVCDLLTASDLQKDRLKEEWAFDFPGWIGDLSEPNNNCYRRKIMVIGMEPHIESRYFQVAFGLRDLHAERKGELVEHSNGKLWTNLHRLFKGNSRYTDDFLRSLYVTDLCHFAPKGEANLINRIKEESHGMSWAIIREKIALAFLPREIELVDPCCIVSQGKDVTDLVDNEILKKMSNGDIEKHQSNEDGEKFETAIPNGYRHLPFFTKYRIEGKNIYHIGLPHITSGNTNGFWSMNRQVVEELGEELRDFIGGDCD